jgi:3-hydroxybutyryl-CoA dehydrogenase
MSDIKRITVIGAGTMGHGIAHVASAVGYHVVLHDVSAERVEKGLEAIRASLARGMAKGKVSPEQREATLSGIRTSTDLSAAVGEADLIVEAVPESLDLKRSVLREVDEAAPGGAVLATNTSSLSVARIAEATGRPEQVVGMHFFNPVQLMPLLEVVRSAATSEAAVRTAREVGARLGKETIVVRDSPGFATSRLGLVLGLEAIRMLEQEVASAEDIDKAMTLGYRHPMGPLRLTDLVGLDVRLAIARYLHGELGSEAFRPPELLERMVAEGKLGRKSGVGFYRWNRE